VRVRVDGPNNRSSSVPRHRDDHDAAAFRWPDIGDRFNWALD
jgi:hypothetical protein